MWARFGDDIASFTGALHRFYTHLWKQSYKVICGSGGENNPDDVIYNGEQTGGLEFERCGYLPDEEDLMKCA